MKTVQSHAYILTTIHGVFYMLLLILTCNRTHKLEKIGTFIVFIAIVLMIADPEAVKKGESIDIKNSFISLLGNVPGVILWISIKQLMAKLDTVTVVCLTIIGVNVLNIIAALMYEGALLDMSDLGIFGFLRTEYLFLTFFLCAVMAGFWGWSGYILSL